MSRHHEDIAVFVYQNQPLEKLLTSTVPASFRIHMATSDASYMINEQDKKELSCLLRLMVKFANICCEEHCKHIISLSNDWKSFRDKLLIENNPSLSNFSFRSQLWRKFDVNFRKSKVSDTSKREIYEYISSLVFFRIVGAIVPDAIGYNNGYTNTLNNSKSIALKLFENNKNTLDQEKKENVENFVDACISQTKQNYLYGIQNMSFHNDLKKYVHDLYISTQIESNIYIIPTRIPKKVEFYIVRPIGEARDYYRHMIQCKKSSYHGMLIKDYTLSKKFNEAAASYHKAAIATQRNESLAASYFNESGHCYREVAEHVVREDWDENQRENFDSFIVDLRKAASRYVKAADCILVNGNLEGGKRNHASAELIKKASYAIFDGDKSVANLWNEAATCLINVEESLKSNELQVAIWYTKASRYYSQAAESEKAGLPMVSKHWERAASMAVLVCSVIPSSSSKQDVLKLLISSSNHYKRAADAEMKNDETLLKYCIGCADNLHRAVEAIEEYNYSLALLYAETGEFFRKAADAELMNKESGTSKYWERIANSYLRAAKAYISGNQEIVMLYCEAGGYYEKSTEAAYARRDVLAKYWDRAGASCVRSIKCIDAKDEELASRYREACDCYRYAAESQITSNEDAASYWSKAGDSTVLSAVEISNQRKS